MNIFLKQAADYMGISSKDKLSKTDEKRLRAKAKKIKISYKKSQRVPNNYLTRIASWYTNK